MNLKEGNTMVVTATEFKSNLGRYLELVATQDVYITKNGKNIARLTSPSASKLAVLDELVGIAADAPVQDEDSIRRERLARQ